MGVMVELHRNGCGHIRENRNVCLCIAIIEKLHQELDERLLVNKSERTRDERDVQITKDEAGNASRVDA
jgi:hypothetical protein